jgi:hypothetical protein
MALGFAAPDFPRPARQKFSKNDPKPGFGKKLFIDP